MKLSEYMHKVEKIYKDAAPEYVALTKKLEQAQKDAVKIQGDADLSPKGKQARLAALSDYRKEIQAEMDKIGAAADNQAWAVRDEVELRFYGHYHARAADLDPKGMELLISGILTNAELVHLTESYAGNGTMQRICATYLARSKDPALQSMANRIEANATQDTHLRCIDSIIDIGRRCVGRPDTAEAFLTRFDEIAAQTYAVTPDIDDCEG